MKCFIFLMSTCISLAHEGHARKNEVVPNSPGYVAPFELTDQDGKVFSSAELQGKTWLANFIFTSCKVECPMMTADMKKIYQATAQRDDLVFVSMTSDPANDTPAVLKKFASSFGIDHRRWKFLTGPKAAIVKLSVESFKLAMSTTSVDHSLRFVVVGPDFRIQKYVDSTNKQALKALGESLVRTF